MEAMRCLRRRLSDVVYRQLIADAQAQAAAQAGPGEHSGATLLSSAADLPPGIGFGPATSRTGTRDPTPATSIAQDRGAPRNCHTGRRAAAVDVSAHRTNDVDTSQRRRTLDGSGTALMTSRLIERSMSAGVGEGGLPPDHGAGPASSCLSCLGHARTPAPCGARLPRPGYLGAFYSQLLGQPVIYQSDDWVVVAANGTSSGLAFQLAPGHRPPTWPDPAVPQQFHLDVMVEDVTSAGPRVLALGARKLNSENVYADPAGHPFCLIPRPGWAPPIPAGG